MIKYQICKKTVMDSSDPKIFFDIDGISNYYWNFHNDIKKHWHNDNYGSIYLKNYFEKIKIEGANKEFDCLLGLSGGADSSYMLHKIVTQYGLRPLIFHVDGGWNTDTAVHNINALVEKLGLELFTEVIDWEEMKNFQLAMFKSGVPHLDIPQDLAFVGVLYKFASKYNIKYILNGGNISTECVSTPLEIFYWGTDMRHIRGILNKYGQIDMPTYPFSSIYYHKIYLKFFRGIKVIKPLNYLNYNKKEAMKNLEEIYGWRPYSQKHFESRFTKFFESFWLPTRFNYDIRRKQLSSLILTEQLTRKEALEILESDPYDKKNIHHEIDFISR